ncbi:hypothetical protein BB561_000537 [Smittium simulii]|uniref:Cdc23 domain-containing protein n=1 Tax=Smittium simulii TaxID=133385 RepID=A0A2T9YYL4_9FUNG|nr:hypothetical protein BB561_000537 [Smittium simulii]
MQTEKQLLAQAVVDCTERGLLKAAEWAAEQLNYYAHNKSDSIDKHTKSLENQDLNSVQSLEAHVNNSSNNHEIQNEEKFVYYYAKTAFDLREFQKVEYILRNCTSNKSMFLKYYSKYLGIEKKEHESIISKEELNNLLAHLRAELDKSYHSFDAFNYFMQFYNYRYGLVLLKEKQLPLALNNFIKSVNMYEYNWSAWLMIEKCLEVANSVDDIEKQTCGNIVKKAFMAHLSLEAQIFTQTSESQNNFLNYLSILKLSLSNSPFVLGLEAVYFYNLREFEKAEQLLESIYSTNPYSLNYVDIHSNILYVMGDKQKLAQLAKKCTEIQKNRPETCCNYYSLRNEHEKSAIYFEKALKLDPNYYSAWTLLGHEYMHMKNTSQAIGAYRGAVNLNKRDYRAWYGLGLTYEMLKLPHYAIYYFQQASALRPNDYRMLTALANCYEASNQISVAIECYKKILVESPENKSIALYKLGHLYNQIDQKDYAAQFYKILIKEYITFTNINLNSSIASKPAIVADLSFDLGSDIYINMDSELNQNQKSFIDNSFTSAKENSSEMDQFHSKNFQNNLGSGENHSDFTLKHQLDSIASESLLFLAKYEIEKNNISFAKIYLNILISNGSLFRDKAEHLLNSIKNLST